MKEKYIALNIRNYRSYAKLEEQVRLEWSLYFGTRDILLWTEKAPYYDTVVTVVE